MQIEVSVKNPLRGLRPASAASAAGASVSWSSQPSLVESSPNVAGGIGDRVVAGLDRCAGAGLVVGDQASSSAPVRPAARTDVAGSGLGLLDLHVRVQRHAEQVVGRVTADDGVTADAPVVRQPDLVHGAAADRPAGVIRSVTSTLRLDGRAGRDDGGPPVGLEAALGGQLRGDLAEHLRLQLREVRQPAAHPAGGVVLGQPVGGEHVRVHVRARVAGARRAEVVRAREHQPGRALLLRVERVGDRRLLRLVVGGQRPVDACPWARTASPCRRTA